MRITTRHPASRHGRPVILDDCGRLMDQRPGLAAAMERLGWTRAELAARAGVSVRTVEGWFQGRPPEVAALNVLADALAALEPQAK